jgi:ribosomal protein S1
VSGTITKIDDENIYVRLDSSGVLATLHKSHLCDISKYSLELFQNGKYKVGNRIENAAIISKSDNDKSNNTNITLKPLLLSCFNSKNPVSYLYPNKISDLKPGQEVVGCIWKVETYGVLVKFRDGMTALAPRPNVADKFITTPVGLFESGDSVRCIVQRVDLTRDRAIVTLKPAVITPSSGSVMYLDRLLNESFISNPDINNENPQPNWRQYKIGSVINAIVSSVKDYGVVLMADDRVSMMLAPLDRKSHSEGTQVEVVILDIDMEHQVFNVSLDSDLVKTIKKANSKSKKSSKQNTSKSINVSDVITAKIILLKNQYLVVQINDSVGYVMISDYHCPYLTSSTYEIGQDIMVRLEKNVSNDKLTDQYPYDNVLLFSVYAAVNEQHRNQAVKSSQEGVDSDAKVDNENENIVDNVSLRVGAVFKWEITEITSHLVRVKLESSNDNEEVEAMLHVSCAINSCDGFDDIENSLEKAKSLSVKQRHEVSSLHPFAKLNVGGVILGRILQLRRGAKHGEDDDNASPIIYIGLVPSNNSKKRKASHDDANNKWRRMIQWSGSDAIKKNMLYAGVVTSFNDIECVIALSPYITTKLNYLDVSNDTNIRKQFQNNCYIGMKVVIGVISINERNRNDSNNKSSNLIVSRACVENYVSGVSIVDLSKNKQVSIDLPVIKSGELVSGIIDLSAGRRVANPPSIHVILGM